MEPLRAMPLPVLGAYSSAPLGAVLLSSTELGSDSGLLFYFLVGSTQAHGLLPRKALPTSLAGARPQPFRQVWCGACCRAGSPGWGGALGTSEDADVPEWGAWCSQPRMKAVKGNGVTFQKPVEHPRCHCLCPLPLASGKKRAVLWGLTLRKWPLKAKLDGSLGTWALLFGFHTSLRQAWGQGWGVPQKWGRGKFEVPETL